MKKVKGLTSTAEFVDRLQKEKELLQITQEIDPHLELAELQRQVSARKGPALLFTQVKGTPFPVATNLYGSTRRMELAFGKEPYQFISALADLAQNLMPPSLEKLWGARGLAMKGLKVGMKKQSKGPVQEVAMNPVNLGQLPQIKSWPEDGGPFVTLPLVYTESPSTGKGNLGMYRVQLFDATTAGMHIQIHRGGGYHYHEAENLGRPLPARVLVGGPPALTIAAVAPLPEDIPELAFASLLLGERLSVGKDELGTRLPLQADFAISGYIPPQKRRPEGPFGDHYGYYSLQHDYPYLEVTSLTHRKNAIWAATVVGRPPQEDHYIAEFLQEILEPLFPLVMHNVKKIWAYEESGVHSLAGAIVQNRYPKEAFTAALRILSEGQLSLTKFLLLTDQPAEVKNFKELFMTVLERADLKTDLFVFSNISQDTLDYTGPAVNEGSKAILMGLGEEKRFTLKNQLPEQAFADSNLNNPRLFCPGVLCVEGAGYALQPQLATSLAQERAIQDYRVVCLVDDAQATTKSNEDFIWHVFTRFEPAADLYGDKTTHRFHTGINGPLVIDCRMKPGYPKVLEPDPETVQRVETRFGKLLNQMEKKL